MKKEIISNSSFETKKYGFFLARKIIQKKETLVIALEGDLGGGKTTFAQGFAKGLGIKESVTSPTFLIFKKYKTKTEKIFYHFDAYRVAAEDIQSLGFDEIISKKNNIIAIEWAGNIKNILPQKSINIYFQFEDKNKRRLIIKSDSDIMTEYLTDDT